MKHYKPVCWAYKMSVYPSITELISHYLGDG